MAATSNPALRIAASAALIERGCVYLIGLDGLKTEIGPRWEKLKKTVWAHLESLLSQKLGATDFYIQVDEMSFLVSMPTAIAEEAQIFCLRVAHDLHTSLLGGCDTAKLHIARVTGTEDDSVQSGPIGGEALRLLACQAGLETPADGETLAPSEKILFHPAPASIFRHKFIPIWDAQKEAVTTYRSVSSLVPHAVEAKAPDLRARSDLAATLFRIREATNGLARHLAIGNRFMVWIPVTFEVLSSPIGRMEIAGLCRSLSSELRPYLIFEIKDLPQGVPQSRLAELAGSLKPFCRGVAAQLSARVTNYGAYLGAGLQAIGLSFSAGSSDMDDEISKLSHAANKQRIMSFVLDLPSRDQLQLARSRGIHLISSPLIGKPLDDPAPIRRLSVENIPALAQGAIPPDTAFATVRGLLQA